MKIEPWIQQYEAYISKLDRRIPSAMPEDRVVLERMKTAMEFALGQFRLVA